MSLPLSSFLIAVGRALWRLSSIPGERVDWHRGDDGSIRLELLLSPKEVHDDVTRDAVKPGSTGRST